MAQRFVKKAAAQLNPIYKGMIQAEKARIPAIQQLYQSLNQGLLGTQATENQNILESAAARGLTRSSTPVDQQNALAQTVLQEQSKLGAQQAQDVAGVRSNIGQLRLQRAQGVQSLADLLINRNMQREQNAFERQMAERQFAMQQASSGGGGGGGGYGTALNDFKVKDTETGGMNFFTKNGQPITAAQYAAATGQTVVDLLSRSKDPNDARILEEALAARGNRKKQNALIKKYPYVFGF